MIEERLRDIIAKISREPKELAGARFTLNQAMFLCRAITGRQDEPPWDFIKRLNEARNKIVHRLDPGNFDDLLVSVIAKLRADYAEHVGSSVNRFRVAVIYTLRISGLSTR